MMLDYVRIMVSITPKINASNFMQDMKGKSEPMMFERLANFKYKLGNRNLWGTGYYVNLI